MTTHTLSFDGAYVTCLSCPWIGVRTTDGRWLTTQGGDGTINHATAADAQWAALNAYTATVLHTLVSRGLSDDKYVLYARYIRAELGVL